MGVYHVRLLDETAFSFLDSNKSPGALRACKRADSRLRSAKSRPRYQGKKDLRETPTQTESTGHSGTGGCIALKDESGITRFARPPAFIPFPR